MNNMKTYNSEIIDNLLDTITPLEQAQTDAKMMLAARISDAMKAKGWKNKDLLAAVNKENPSVITKWLSGTHNFTMDTLVELQRALDINLMDIEEKREDIVIDFHTDTSKNNINKTKLAHIYCYSSKSKKPDKINCLA